MAEPYIIALTAGVTAGLTTLFITSSINLYRKVNEINQEAIEKAEEDERVRANELELMLSQMNSEQRQETIKAINFTRSEDNMGFYGPEITKVIEKYSVN